MIESAITTFTRAGDAGSEPMLGVAYLERSKLHTASGHHEAAQSDIRLALARLQAPECARMLRQGRTLAREFKIKNI
ncbi:MAG: hypothetical protein WBP11_11640 [Dokdonella sp.]